MSRWLYFGVMFCAGAVLALQPSINATLARRVGILGSACISFGVGTLALLLATAVWGQGTIRGVSQAAWWELTGGLLGALFVSLTILSVPRIGTTAALGATIAAQLTTGLWLDSVGAFGMPAADVSLRRIAGALLLLAGAALVTAK